MPKGRRIAALLLLAAALGLAALGQFYFFRRRDYLWDGLVLHSLAVLCFAAAWRLGTLREQKAPALQSRSLQLRALFRRQLVPTAFMLLGLLLSVAATLLLRNRAWNQDTLDAVVLWLLGMGSTLAAVACSVIRSTSLPSDWGFALRAVDRKTWLEIATVATLTILAFLVRVASLETVPYTLGGDEAWHGLLARQVVAGELRNPFVMGYMSMPTFFYWPLGWSLRLVGDNTTGLRLPAALVGSATVPLLYLFARRLWGRRIAVLSALFLAVYDYHVHYSRLGANNVWDPLFVLLTLWLLDIGLASGDEERRTQGFTLAGMVMGLSVYYYTGARLLPLLVAIYVAFVWLKSRLARHQGLSPGKLGWPLLMLGLAFLITAGPMLIYALTHIDDWNARINQVGIIQSGWLAREPGLTGKSMPYVLAEQLLRSAGAFHAFRDRTAWYGADRPLLGPLAGAFAILGMGWSLLHWRERRYFLILIWFWSVIISGGMLTESPPSSQRLVIAIPAVALFVAIGLERSVALLQRLLGQKDEMWAGVVVTAVMVVLAVGAVRFYFLEFTPSRRYGTANGETATMVGYYLRELEPGTVAYFFGAPRIYWSFGTMTFLAPQVDGLDVVEPLDALPDFVDTSKSAVFLFLPERVQELSWIQKALPQGDVRNYYDAEGGLRFTIYEVPPQW